MQRRLCLGVTVLIASVAIAGCGGGGSLSPGIHGPGATQPPGVVRDDWTMYAHDARHTSASSASITGPLKVIWRYQPTPISGDNFSGLYNAVATASGVYVHWTQYGSGVFSGGPSFDAVSTSGMRVWSFCEHKDFDEGHWLAVYNSNVVFNDDGQGFLNINSGATVKTGKKSWPNGFDMWGESIPDASGLYSANTFKADGSDLFIYSLDSNGAARWTQNQQKSTKYSNDQDGGLLLSNGVVFYAANYTSPTPFASGIYALNASTGSQLAYVSTTPTSEMSADASNIYLVEGSNLVARAQTNLHQVWSVSLPGTDYAAPVVANGLVIVSTGNAIQAYKATNGTFAWAASIPAFAAPGYTNMAAATSSNTLVVAANQSLYLLNLANGKQIWTGSVSGAMGSVNNPVIVSDPARGAIVYVADGSGVLALTQ